MRAWPKGFRHNKSGKVGLVSRHSDFYSARTARTGERLLDSRTRSGWCMVWSPFRQMCSRMSNRRPFRQGGQHKPTWGLQDFLGELEYEQ